MLDLVVNLLPARLLAFIVGPLPAGDLLLFVQTGRTGLYIRAVAGPLDRVTAFVFFLDLFEMDDDVCGFFQQRFIMRDKQNRLRHRPDKLFQPAQCLQVQIVRRFVKKQHVRIPGQQTHQAHLDLFAPGQDRKGACARPELHISVHLPQGDGQTTVKVHPLQIIRNPSISGDTVLLGKEADRPGTMA